MMNISDANTSFPNLNTTSILNTKEMNDIGGGDDCSAGCREGCRESCKKQKPAGAISTDEKTND